MSHYFSPGNSIRAWDEAHGVHLKIDPNTGVPCFSAEYEKLFADSLSATYYPEYFKSRTLEKFNLIVYTAGEHRLKAEKAYNMTIRYINNLDKVMREFDGIGLYYYSHERGTGKTFLSSILGNELSILKYKVRWFAMTDLLQQIKDSYDKGSDTSTATIIDNAKHAQVLILDDNGVEKQSAWVNETIYNILYFRMTMRRPTIFTSNYRPHELSYDERIIDRISRMSELIEMPEESIRKKLTAKSKLVTFLKEAN